VAGSGEVSGEGEMLFPVTVALLIMLLTEDCCPGAAFMLFEGWEPQTEVVGGRAGEGSGGVGDEGGRSQTLVPLGLEKAGLWCC